MLRPNQSTRNVPSCSRGDAFGHRVESAGVEELPELLDRGPPQRVENRERRELGLRKHGELDDERRLAKNDGLHADALVLMPGTHSGHIRYPHVQLLQPVLKPALKLVLETYIAANILRHLTNSILSPGHLLFDVKF